MTDPIDESFEWIVKRMMRGAQLRERGFLGESGPRARLYRVFVGDKAVSPGWAMTKIDAWRGAFLRLPVPSRDSAYD